MPNRTEPIQDIAHLGSVELLTPKPDRSRWYFESILGMEAVHSRAGSVYLRGYGDYATATVKLTAAGRRASAPSPGARSVPRRWRAALTQSSAPVWAWGGATVILVAARVTVSATRTATSWRSTTRSSGTERPITFVPR